MESLCSWPMVIKYLKINNEEKVTSTHKHNFGQIIFCCSGKIIVEVKDKKYIVPSMQGLWWKAKLPHSAKIESNSELISIYISSKWEKLYFTRFSDSFFISSVIKELALHAAKYNYDIKPNTEQKRLLQVIADLLCKQKKQYNHLYLPKDIRLKKIQTYLLGPTKNGTSLDTISKVASLSGKQVTRLIKKEININFSTWRQQILIYKSITMMSYENNLTKIALSLGFNSSASFCRTFKAIKGITASMYKKNMFSI